VRDPQVFLFDEPLSNLDAELRVHMRIEIARLHKELQTTMIYVTHDQVEAMTLADQIVVLDKGRISQQGTPLELYNRPANKFVAAFIGSPAMNFFTAQVTGQAGDAVTLTLPGGRSTTITTRGGKAGSGNVDVGVRPEHLRIGATGAPDAAFDGTVRIVEQLGNSTLLYVDTPAGQLIVEGEGNLDLDPGETVSVAIATQNAHLFGADDKVI
jgi:multiple sugar transport system ATP-binding protein